MNNSSTYKEGLNFIGERILTAVELWWKLYCVMCKQTIYVYQVALLVAFDASTHNNTLFVITQTHRQTQ